MEDQWPQWKYLWVCLRDSLSGHTWGLNKLLPHTAWHRTLLNIQVTCDLQVWEGMAMSCTLSCACRLTVEKGSWGAACEIKYGHILAGALQIWGPRPQSLKTTTPIMRRFVLLTTNSSLNLSRCALCPEVKHTCTACRDSVLSTNWL